MDNESWVRGAADEYLIAGARNGDAKAFAELWSRHYRAANRFARRFADEVEAHATVSEAYTRIHRCLLAGGGPTGAFRSYLYTTILDVAKRSVAVVEPVPGVTVASDAGALDRALTTTAFRSLSARWQTVLWYIDVEGIPAEQAASILGITVIELNSLVYRAREGLRAAWLHAHSSEASLGLVDRVPAAA